MKTVLVAGARPQFIKAAALLPALRERGEVCFVRTGQHASESMVDAHFSGLALPQPDVRFFGVAEARAGLGSLLADFGPDRVVVMGDTDSTLAGAQAAADAGVTLAHVEAGARSGEPDLPEEIIRIEVDRLSGLLFCSTPAHADNLSGRDGVHVVGDVMADVLLAHREAILARTRPGDGYGVLTLHRAATADDAGAVRRVLDALDQAATVPVVFPMHPRTAAAVGDAPAGIEVREPMPYLDFMGLVAGARFVATDSGGLQKEACLLGVPCLTLREATEWGETVEAGCNVLVGTDPERMRAALAQPPAAGAGESLSLYGDGSAAQKIAELL